MARYAAVDIGSNSVRMLAAEVSAGNGWKTLAADREVTRLGASVFDEGRISREAADAVCRVLRRIAETNAKLDLLGTRAVATSAVRDASNQEEFIEQASEALGVPVEIISGQEEARLIHLGVQSRWPQNDGSVLIIDVGGGSAEFIAGEGGEMQAGLSRPLGAVRLTENFLRSDPPREVELHRLEQFIDEKFAPVLKKIEGTQFQRVIGTSATAAAVVRAIHGIPRSDREAADRLRVNVRQVKKLYRELSRLDLESRRRIPGIGPRRAEIVVAGVAVFLRAMELLGLESLYYSTAGVRDGVIADLLARGVGRELTRLSRQQSAMMEAMCRKYNVNTRYARHVAEIAGDLFECLEPLHRLPADWGKLLEAAAWLHDVGHFISDTGHHKHSAYIVSSSDLPGFTSAERQVIALLCRYHRKSMPQVRHEGFRGLSPDRRRALLLLTPLMRLAVALNSSREHRVDKVSCTTGSGGAVLRITGRGDLDLELWAAERAADVFREVYEMPLAIERVES